MVSFCHRIFAQTPREQYVALIVAIMSYGMIMFDAIPTNNQTGVIWELIRDVQSSGLYGAGIVGIVCASLVYIASIIVSARE